MSQLYTLAVSAIIVVIQLNVLVPQAPGQQCLNEIKTVCGDNRAMFMKSLEPSVCIARWQPIIARGQTAVINELDTNSAQTAGPALYNSTIYHAYHGDKIFIMLEECAGKIQAHGNKKKPADEEDKKKARCSDPPSFATSVEIEDGGTASNAVYAGVSYCMAYVSSRTSYPLDCHLRGRGKTLFPGHEHELFEGWPLAQEETCEAHVRCEKTVFPLLLKQYCSQ